MKILIVRLSAFGDILHALPALCALRRAHPSAEIHWVVSKRCAPLLNGHPAVDKLHLLERGRLSYLEMGRMLRNERFDAAIDLQGLFKSAGLAWMSGARQRIGRSFSACREPLSSLLNNERIRPKETHIIKQNLELITPLGVKDLKIEYNLVLPKMEIPSFFREKPVAINVGGGWPTKRYPPEKWGEAARRITEEMKRPVAVFWGPGEEKEAETVIQRAPKAVLAPKTTYLEMARLLKECRVLLSSETGPLHLAVAVGTPTVCVIGVTDPERNGPLDERSRVVLPPPPRRWTYQRTGENPTERIPVEELLAAAEDLL